MNSDGLAASHLLKDRRQEIAERVTALYFEARPELEQRWKGARKKCTEDNGRHLDYLSEALSFGKPSLFTEYIAWTAVLLARLKIPGEALDFNLELLKTTLASELKGASGLLASEYIEAARSKIEGPLVEIPSYLEGSQPIDVLAREYLAALLRGERRAASELILAAADGGTPVKEIYLLVFQRVQREIGRLWQHNLIGVAQEHY